MKPAATELTRINQLASSDAPSKLAVTRIESRKSSLLQGEFVLVRYQSGMMVHACDATELADQDTEFSLGAGISLTVLLEGELEFSVDDHHHHLRAEQGNDGQCFAIIAPQARQICRYMRTGRKLNKVNVAINRHWLEQYANENATAKKHITKVFSRAEHYSSWPANANLKLLAAEILKPPAYAEFLQSLYIESRALEIVSTALHQLTLPTPITTQPKRSIENARDYIEAHLHSIASLDELAATLGTSISALQRQFKQRYQSTVFEYIRKRKLEAAKLALSKQQISIGEAAYMAGYRHSSNFLTAFKRTFGITPAELTGLE